MDQPMKKNRAANLATTSPKLHPNSKRKNNGRDYGRRKRVSQACDACRRKKLKCEGSRPSCSACVAQERECVYGIVTKKRGLPEGYVRGLERLLALLLAKDGGGSVNSKFQQALVDEKTRVSLIRQWNGELGERETLAEAWRTSQLCRAFETLLPELDAPDMRGLGSKKPRLEPHAVGTENPRAKNSRSAGRREDNSTPSGKVDDPETIEANIPNQFKFSAMDKGINITTTNLIVPSNRNIAAHGLLDVGLEAHLYQQNLSHLDSMQSTLSMPDNLSGVMDEFALDLKFNDMMGADDLFFEMSNLDYLYVYLSELISCTDLLSTGDRDETYRNLGFLRPQDGSDSLTTISKNHHYNYHPGEGPGS